MELFQRDFSVKIIEKSKNTLLICTTMEDMFHHFILKIEVSIPSYEMKFIALEMPRRPHERCTALQQLVKRLEGTKVSKGFIKEVTKTLGGKQGCPNMVNLFFISAPLAINAAALLYKKEHKLSDQEMDGYWHDLLGGICLAYSEEDEEI